jgi:hypothetical protein
MSNVPLNLIMVLKLASKELNLYFGILINIDLLSFIFLLLRKTSLLIELNG